MSKSKNALMISTTIAYIQLIIGVLLVLLFLVGLTIDIILSSIILGLPSFLLLFLSHKNLKLISNFQKYVATISNIPNGSIQNIAAALNTSTDVVKANLEIMIEKKFFANAYIDYKSNCIIINGRKIQNNMTSPSANEIPQSETQTPRMVTVKCEGCGATNAIQKGTVGECEYCGTPIKG